MHSEQVLQQNSTSDSNGNPLKFHKRNTVTMSVTTKARIGLQTIALRAVARPLPTALEFDACQAREAERERERMENIKEQHKQAAFGNPEWKQSLQVQLNKSFSIHLGADLRLPCSDKPAPVSDAPAANHVDRAHVFDGVPLARLAEAIGAKVAPVYHEYKKMETEAQRETKLQAQASQPWDVQVPHFLPFTRIATQHPEFRKTFVFDEADRKTARLSWYHPDDTMVPRDWFKGGLLADLKYYFGKN